MSSYSLWARLLVLGGILVPSSAGQPAMHLTLAEARRLTIQNNPRLSAAQLNAAAAYQAVPEYKSNYQPNVAGSFTSVEADNGSRLASGGLNNPVVYSRVGSGLTVSQMITDFGRTSNLVGMAKLQAQAQDQETEATRAQLLLIASRAYFSLLRAHALLRVADQTVQARSLVSEQVGALAESKLKSTFDVSLANVNLADAKLLQIQAQNEVKATEAELAAAIGLPGEAGFVLDEEPMPTPLPDRVDGLIRDAMQERPDLKEMRLQQNASERFTKAEHALYYPYVGVLGTSGLVPTGYSTLPERYGAIGLNITIPIFNGGLFKARQTQAELKAKAATQNTNDLENQVTRNVRVAYLNATTAYDRMAVTAQLLKQATLALDLAQTRYDAGLGTIVELSTAQLNLTSAQIANTNAQYDYQAQRVVVDYQTGVLR